MKFLILHQHFKTPQIGGPIRSYYLAKALLENGHSVIVVTGHNEKQYKKESVEGIEVHYLPVAYSNNFGFTARISSFLKYVIGVIRRENIYHGVDICYAISTPLTIGIAALALKWRRKIPFVFEVGDLWPEAPIQMGFIKNSFMKWMLYKLEIIIYTQAEFVVALSSSIREAIQKKNIKKVYVIPNMADIAFFKPEEKNLTLERTFQVEDKFVVSYLGSFGLANGLDYFLDCARASQKANLPVHFLLNGEGAMLPNLKQSMKRLQLNNLSIIPFQNRDGVRELMNVTDAIFVCYKSVPVLETGSPNKYFDGLAAGKLIIINFGGWIKNELETESCGIYVSPFHPTEFVKHILPFIEDKNRLIRYQKRSRELAESKYARDVLGKQFVEIFKNC